MSEMNEEVLDEAMENSTEENASETQTDENVTSKRQLRQQIQKKQKMLIRILKIQIKRNLFSKRKKIKRMSRSKSLLTKSKDRWQSSIISVSVQKRKNHRCTIWEPKRS